MLVIVLTNDLFIQLQGNGDLGETAPTQGGKTLHRSKPTRQTTIRSTFGPNHFEQFAYAPGVKKTIELRPISARMTVMFALPKTSLPRCFLTIGMRAKKEPDRPGHRIKISRHTYLAWDDVRADP
ncbi:hypothetical protein [Allorhodopirellula heiligendammensis]|uniref:Uncharacterized protein n=1 Tax=Allorhodopirellula heiligendammensis TaxID=2714739 RepID=A0A5C6B2C9_9BACT|nr:hypothetical protein [Allorhodopirellula heiligendammensis]TWU05386.1 hypothetical protein Poly21_57030 [Allorhodopirellula heiligendammensis]